MTKISDSPSTLIENLQLHKVELEAQNQDLRSTQTQLLIQRQRYNQLFHQSPVGYVLLDQDGHIRDLNQTFCRLKRNKKIF